jgi:hypothetical protein
MFLRFFNFLLQRNSAIPNDTNSREIIRAAGTFTERFVLLGLPQCAVVFTVSLGEGAQLAAVNLDWQTPVEKL